MDLGGHKQIKLGLALDTQAQARLGEFGVVHTELGYAI